uniref:Cadherin domain protein n=1 Tax=Heterorhabditis bacteriophora TaxID=37862 RepID=A0A1I7XFP4_HETBA
MTFVCDRPSSCLWLTLEKRRGRESLVGLLDYEDPVQQQGFRLTVRVNDGLHDAISSIVIDLLDRNDHAPDIAGPSEVRISEDAERGIIVASFTVTDRDASDENSARFRINRQSDPKRQFTIDQDGTLRVAQRLDREDIASYKLIIEAFDAAGNVGTQLVAVYLQDVNDNGPEPYLVPKYCIFMENTPVVQQGTCEIQCTDRDSPEYGPPFQMQLDTSKWMYGEYLSVTFDPSGDSGNGSMTIRPLVVFDREATVPGKVLEIPLILTDRAGKTNHASVHVIIGDEVSCYKCYNDNPMHDGKMTITVNSYLGKLKKTNIGRVYVEDLDDWDLGDKTFTWRQSLSGFDLSPRGEITMDANMAPGTYHMSANVHDNRRSEDAVGHVTVIVQVVPEVAFVNQGAMQLLIAEGTNLHYPEDFIRVNSSGMSMMSVFTSEMMMYMSGSVAIDVFSVQLGRATLQNRDVFVLNVRFSAHGIPYRDPTQLNGMISAHREELQAKMGATIVGVGIDMCKFTVCDSGCQTLNTADFDGILVSANNTVLVGVNSTSRDDCTCPVWRAPVQCQAGVCHNDGVCHNTHPGFFCECRNDFLKGSRCQGTTRSFGGDGVAWYKPMPACTSLNISMQFMTLQLDAILFYNGPMDMKTNENQIDYRDYIIIQLKGGRLSLEYIELVVDQCRFLGANTDEKSCRDALQTPDDDERLNIVAPIQIGGLTTLTGGQSYPLSVPPGLNGCVRNLVVNDDQYDLATPSYEKNSASGCKLWGSACDSNGIETLGHCVHGDCYADVKGSNPLVAKCICDPGWGGARCEKKIEWVQFQSGGFVEYGPKIAFPEQFNDIKLLFIPGRVSGVAELASGADKIQNSVSTSVEMTGEGLIPVAKIDLGGMRNSATSLKLSDVSLKENASYWMHFTRNPTRTSLSIDGAYHISQVLSSTSNLQQPFALQVRDLFLGGHNRGRGFQGCVGAYRWSNQNLPLRKPINQVSDPDDENIVIIKKSEGVSEGCNLLITCAQLPIGYCSGAMVCMDFWKGAFCTCPDGANTMLMEDGQLAGCGETLAVAKLGISSPAIILILVSLVLLIMLVLLMVVYTRRQTAPFECVRPEDMNRDNLRPYDIEGGGEADNDQVSMISLLFLTGFLFKKFQYSIANLRKPVMAIDGNGLSVCPVAPPIYARPPIDERLNSQIKDLQSDQNAAPFDEIRIYDDERDDASMVTLESLGSIPDTERCPTAQVNRSFKYYRFFSNLSKVRKRGRKSGLEIPPNSTRIQDSGLNEGFGSRFDSTGLPNLISNGLGYKHRSSVMQMCVRKLIVFGWVYGRTTSIPRSSSSAHGLPILDWSTIITRVDHYTSDNGRSSRPITGRSSRPITGRSFPLPIISRSSRPITGRSFSPRLLVGHPAQSLVDHYTSDNGRSSRLIIDRSLNIRQWQIIPPNHW